MSTASLLSLETEPIPTMTGCGNGTSRWNEVLGLDSSISKLNIIGLLTTAFFSISFLVFLNAAQSFVLTSLLNEPISKVGGLTGTLLLADEILSLLMVIIWGVTCDLVGVRQVATIGHLFVALGFISFVNAPTFPTLVAARLVYAFGASSLVTSLTAGLALFTPVQEEKKLEEEEEEVNERSGLLTAREGEGVEPKVGQVTETAQNGTFTGIVGAIAGCGALLAVFGYLRLPNLLTTLLATHFHYDLETSARLGLIYTFYLIAGLAILEGGFLWISLDLGGRGKVDLGELGVKERIGEVVSEMGRGFLLAWRERDLGLAFATGFVTRAQSVIVTSFVPLLINNFFIENGLCNLVGEVEGLGGQACRQAFLLSSKITGTIQLLSLLFCPILGYLSTRHSPALILSISISLGGSCFLGFSLLKNGDPRSWLVYIYSIGMGISQASGLVLSLSLVGIARAKVVAQEGKEVGGAIAGAYSFCGGFGILFLGKMSGVLFDSFSGAPFFLIFIADFLVASFAIFCWVRSG